MEDSETENITFTVWEAKRGDRFVTSFQVWKEEEAELIRKN